MRSDKNCERQMNTAVFDSNLLIRRPTVICMIDQAADARERLRIEFVQVADRLHAEFDARAGSATVDHAFAAVASRFRGATVLTFVPVLVEREARAILKEPALSVLA